MQGPNATMQTMVNKTLCRKLKYWAINMPMNNGDELRCSGRVGSNTQDTYDVFVV